MGTGDRYKVLSYRKESVDNAQTDFKKIFELGILAKYQAILGELDGAEKTLAIAEGIPPPVSWTQVCHAAGLTDNTAFRCFLA